MAIDIKFDLVGNPEPPTIILASRNDNKLGQLDVNAETIELNDKFNDISEISFTLNKYIDGKVTNLWDKVVDFKLVYCKEWDMWFEIKVELDEETETVKTVFCTQLGQAELSQIKLYNIEINTENDIARDDYKITVLYDEKDKKSSLLDRLLEKAPHYSIAHVDSTIKNIQRTFSFDDTSICDAFHEIGEEIGCLFIYNSNSDENGKIQRTISVYDLWQNCKDCGYRGEFTDKCSKCNSTNITNGYGEDTLIFVTSDELASDGISLVTDTDSVKNCFKLEAGDDLMTATIRNCNPNGTDYIWYFSDTVKEDMSDELVEKIESYDKQYQYYYNEHKSELDNKLLTDYNALIEKYKPYYNAKSSTCLSCGFKGDFEAACSSCGSKSILVGDKIQTITTPIVGYSNLMSAYYNVIDFELYLKSSLMPSVEIADTDAIKQAALLTRASLSPVAVANEKTVSLATANSSVLAMAKIVIKSTYKVEVKDSELSGDKKTWTGSFVITNYSDEEDTAISDIIKVDITGNEEEFIKQKIDKALNKENTDDLSISGLFEKELDDFCTELKKYALNPLISFHDACQSCIDILIEQGVADKNTWGDNTEGAESNLYERLYVPYYNKLKAVESEMKIREDEINIINGIYDVEGKLISEGLRSNIEKCRNQIQNVLDFEKYLGNKLWLEFCCYRREDKYSNSNYISDGLNNAELFRKAFEFFEVAENEIFKSAELQHSISTTLNNLLAIEKFKPLVRYFKVGNWIRIQVDNKIYKLRLLEYGIDFGNFDNISVEFSDVIRIKSGITDVKSVLSQASSMASSYSSVKRQASQGEKSNAVLDNWFENGLDVTNTKIVGAENQNQLWGKNGFLCREYDPITETYSDEQLKIINATLAITDDNWKSTKTAVGKYYYTDPVTGELKMTYGVNGETIVGKLLIGEDLIISNNGSNLEFGEDGLVVKNDKNTVEINPNDEVSIFNIKYQDNNIFSLNSQGQLVITGNITALDGSSINTNNITGLADVALSGEYNDLKNRPNLATVATSGSYNDLNNRPSLTKVATSGSYKDLSDTPTKLSDFTNDSSFITKDVNNLTNYYNKGEIDSSLSSKVNVNDLATVATSGSYNDLIDIQDLKNWVLEQIQLATNQ